MKIKKYVLLYFSYLKIYFLSIAEYKVDFIIGLISIMSEQIISLAFITIIFNKVKTINGWGYYEMLLIYAFSILGRSIHIIFF